MPRSLLRSILELAEYHAERVEAFATRQGQSRARLSVLLASRHARSVPSIARELGHTRQSVQRIADALAESGLVHFESNPSHRRSPLIRLTVSGARLADRLERDVQHWEEAALSGLDPEEIETLLLALDTLREGLER
jgi:DNA-binding MarR family transcriptional regulator